MPSSRKAQLLAVCFILHVLASTSPWPLRLASCALTFAGLWSFAAVAEELSAKTALAALALAGLNPLMVIMAGSGLPEIPLLAAGMAALNAARRKDWAVAALCAALTLPFWPRPSISHAPVAVNAAYYLKFAFVTMWLRWPRDWPWLSALTVGCGAVATGYGVKGSAKTPALFLLLFAGALLLSPRQAGRFALPALPLVYVFLLRGLYVLRLAPLGATALSLGLLAAQTLSQRL